MHDHGKGDLKAEAPEAGAASLLSDYMTREDLAAELGVSKDTLARWHTQRIGPPSVKLGKRTFYRREVVRAWLVDRERGAVARPPKPRK